MASCPRLTASDGRQLNNMTDDQIIDIVLKNLHNKMSFPFVNLKTTILKPNNISLDNNRIQQIVRTMTSKYLAYDCSDQATISGETCLSIGDAGLDIMIRFGSYSSFLIDQKKRNNRTATKTVIQIGTPIIFGLTATFFGWQNWTYQKEIQQKDKTIQLQEIETISLRQQLGRKQNTVDSLRIILIKTETTKQ